MEEWIWSILLIHFADKILVLRLGLYIALAFIRLEKVSHLEIYELSWTDGPSWSLRSHPRDSC